GGRPCTRPSGTARYDRAAINLGAAGIAHLGLAAFRSVWRLRDDGRDQTVAPLGDRLDEGRGVKRIADGSTQLGDGPRQRRLADRLAVPNSRDQRILRNDLAWVLREEHQQIHDLGADAERRAITR